MALVSPPTVTVTSTVPVPAGLVAVQFVVEAQLTPVALFGPKRTVVAPAAGSKPVPVIVTTVPPAVGPLVGLIETTVGAGIYVKQALHVRLWLPTVTVTSTAPAA
jgi:hypothetical protein